MSSRCMPFISNRTFRCFFMASMVESNCLKRLPSAITVSIMSVGVLNLPTLVFAEIKNFCGLFPKSKTDAFVKSPLSVVNSRLAKIFSIESILEILGILFLARYLKVSTPETSISEKVADDIMLSQVFPVFFNKNCVNSLPFSSCVVLPLLM